MNLRNDNDYREIDIKIPFDVLEKLLYICLDYSPYEKEKNNQELINFSKIKNGGMLNDLFSEKFLKTINDKIRRALWSSRIFEISNHMYFSFTKEYKEKVIDSILKLKYKKYFIYKIAITENALYYFNEIKNSTNPLLINIKEDNHIILLAIIHYYNSIKKNRKEEVFFFNKGADNIYFKFKIKSVVYFSIATRKVYLFSKKYIFYYFLNRIIIRIRSFL
jgi:hypothetical protein